VIALAAAMSITSCEMQAGEDSGGRSVVEKPILQQQDVDDLVAAANAGDQKAKLRLARLYESGLTYPPDGMTVPPNPVEAARLYQELAQDGNVEAQRKMGQLYFDGYGVPLDRVAASRSYLQAANQDDPQSQYRLGTMYEMGTGTPRDYREAVRWYTLAARQDYPPARLARDILLHRMTAGERMASEQMAEDWVRAHPRTGGGQ
jgi:TPR repeat protein